MKELTHEETIDAEQVFQRELKRGARIMLADLGWTRRKAAKLARINETTLSAALKDAGTMTTGNFARLCAAAGWDRLRVHRIGRDAVRDEMDRALEDGRAAGLVKAALQKLPPEVRKELVKEAAEWDDGNGGEEVA